MAMAEYDDFDPYDMNREEFNPALCMLRYSRECTVPNIIAKKKHIDREIKGLDSELNSLMYDNYQKIDKVTSVIVNIKTDITNMEGEMKNLCDQMNGIARTSSSILKNLQPVKNKMAKLLKFQETIKKLSLLTDLVPTLKMHVNSGMYNVAARCYLKSEKIMMKYNHFPSLHGIVNESSDIVDEIKLGLRNKLNCEIYKREELADVLYLLLALQEAPETLLKDFLVCNEKILSDLLISIDGICDKDTSEENENYFLNKINSYINFCCTYIERMSNILKIANDVFQFQKDLNTDILTTLLNEFFLKNIHQFRIKLLHHIQEKFQDVDDDLLSQALDKFVRQCHESGVVKNEINLFNEGLNIVLQICISRCENRLQTMKEDFNKQLVKQANELTSRTNISHLVLFLMEWTEQKLMSVLLSVIHYIRPEYRCCREVVFRKVFCKVVVREGIFVEFLKHIMETSWQFLTMKHLKCFSKPLLCTILAKFLFDFSSTVPKFLSKVDEYLSSTAENLSLTSAETVVTSFKSTALKIVDFCIQIRCQIMSCMIKKSMENRNWMASKEPTRPRAVIKMILNDIFVAKQESEKIFGTFQKPNRKRENDIGSAMQSEMYSIEDKFKPKTIEEKTLLNRIFLQCSMSPTEVELNSSSVINSLLKFILNSFIQIIRLKTMNDFSLQQIQVDVYYMRSRLSELIELDLLVQVLFDEILASACNRTVSPKIMKNQVVSVICNNNL